MDQMPTNAVATLALAIGSDAILTQEAHGAAAVRSSQQIPAESPSASILAQFGIEVGEPVSGDPLFVNATFPAGWRRDGTGHSMWTNLIPPWSQGPVFAMFYKAAFYDRSSFMRFERRYEVSAYEPDHNTRVNEARVYDRGTGEILHRIPFDAPPGADHYKASRPAIAAAIEWASVNLPDDWRDDVKPWLRLYAAAK